MGSLAELRKLIRSKAEPRPGHKAYACYIRKMRLTFIVSAPSGREARALVLQKAEKADRPLTLGMIEPRRAQQYDDWAKIPELAQPHWYLGYDHDGHKVGCLAEGDTQDEDK